TTASACSVPCAPSRVRRTASTWASCTTSAATAATKRSWSSLSSTSRISARRSRSGWNATALRSAGWARSTIASRRASWRRWRGATMSSLDQNFRDLLVYLNSAGVRYLVLGGYAVNFHGYKRNTQDMDLWIGTDADNAGRVSLALRRFGFAAQAVRSSIFHRK